ncbi:MAG: tetratricopeptide repeat protein [Deltaproteobacteria bacterium]|nr:tetratricopeptide repeat protein [Deltaproteobacteria bacterium]
MAASEASLGPDSRPTLLLAHDVGVSLLALGDQRGGAAQLSPSLEGLERTAGPDDPDALVAADSLGEAFASLGEHARAKGLHARALVCRERLYCPTHFKTLTSLMNLAAAHLGLGLFQEAPEPYARARSGALETLGRNSPRTLKCLTCQGQALAGTGDLAGAREVLERSLALHNEVLGPAAQGTFDAADELAKALTATGSRREACETVSGALAGAQGRYGPVHPNTLRYRTHLGIAPSSAGELEEAGATLFKALEGCLKVFGPSHSSTVNTTLNQFRVMRLKDGPGPARQLHEDLSQALDVCSGPDSPDAVSAAGALGKILAEFGERDRAAGLFWRVEAHREKAYGPAHAETVKYMGFPRAVLNRMGDSFGEMEVFSRVIYAFGEKLGLKPPDPERVPRAPHRRANVSGPAEALRLLGGAPAPRGSLRGFVRCTPRSDGPRKPAKYRREEEIADGRGFLPVRPLRYWL